MKPKLKPIQDQVVVLLGATSGIGLETAKFMAAKGAQVVIVGRSQEGLNDALTQIQTHLSETNQMMQRRGSNGQQHDQQQFSGSSRNFANAEAGGAPVTQMENQVIALEADSTNFEQVKSVADQVVQRFGRIDTWVNIAAVSEWALFEDTSPDEFRRIVDVNLIGQTYGAMAALPYLKQQINGGALIFIASVAGRIPIPYQTAYNASKHGILGLVDTLRVELQHTNVPVSVTAILPASINTPLFEKSRTKIGVEPHPLPPIYDVKLVAKAITYAAQHPVRELIVGDSGYMMTFMRRLAPTITSNMMGAIGFRAQRSDEPKSAQDPDNLYHHISGYDEVQGDFTPETKRISVLTWLSTHPRARMAIYGGLLMGAGALIGWRVVTVRNQRKGWRYQLPRQAKKLSKQVVKASNKAVKVSSKAVKDAGGTLVDLPVISNLPMFHKRSMLERAGDMMLGWWAAITSISLPFLPRRKSMPQRMISRVADSMPDITLPWNRQPSIVERVTLAEQRKAAAERLNKMSDKVMGQVDDSRKRVAKVMDRSMSQADDTRKKAQKVADKTMDRASDKSKRAAKDVARSARASMKDINNQKQTGKTEVVVRRQSFIEKLPFGERRETIIEKERVPVKK